MTVRATVLAGYDMVTDRLETLGEPDTAEVVRQLRRVYLAETGHLEHALTLFGPMLVRR